jgi:hypothetical protein
VATDRTALNNKPDIIIRDKKKGTYKYLFVYAAISGDKCYLERILKDYEIYPKDLAIEMRCMWNVKTKLIPVTRTIGTISKSFRKYQGIIPGKYINYTTTAILGTAHIFQKY